MNNRPRLAIVGGSQQFGQSIEDWFAAHNSREHDDDLRVVAEVHEMLMDDFIGFKGVRVLGERQNRLIYEVGSLARVRMTIIGRDADIWDAAVEAPYNVKILANRLFHPLTTLPTTSDLPEARHYSCYAENHRRFAFWTPSPSKLVAIAWQLSQQIA